MARQTLGPVGICLPVSFTSAAPAVAQREAVARLEHAGYQAIWTNEVIGKDAFVQLGVLLATTERTVFGTFVANIWARPAQTMHAAAAQLAEAYPGRLAVGLGVGYPEQAASVGQEFGSPLATMRDYLERMDSPTWPPAPDAAYPRMIAANGPKMLALAGEIADGAMPAGLPATFTAQAREVLGPDKLLVVGLSVIPDADADRAKAAARESVSGRLAAPSYAARMAGLGYTAQEIAEVGDRLVDALVAHGDSAAVAARVQQHLRAGADQVALLLPIGGEFSAGIDQVEQLAPALAELG
ncbi:MAG TPA: TIGR03620 family F420-dependent LLM class oxidoreductase [Mycobacterium sp.]|uniref:TIGR03620 family F420-dependent LLM class oxidoreductase n=1 Tax=Mycobacterium sp. TaxID=1785 RepID=UPI002C93E6AE|nr:TIGR03620 family F420-dependent LLM class oxidoreductase [Mycobacterium sp.]HME79884.1 TIGR03620 family F420-dependent LLM class oxidoreductase [Mycobacterium sp.]